MSVDYQLLYIFYEGPDDELFLKSVVVPLFERKIGQSGGEIKLTQYGEQRKERINNLLISIQAMGFADYFLLADIDLKACVTAKKRAIKERFPSIEQQKILVVVKEIESWYLAGLDEASSKHLGKGRSLHTTDTLTKEQFETRFLPDRFKTSTSFMVEILKYFDLATAKRKNTSFRYLVEKYQLDS